MYLSPRDIWRRGVAFRYVGVRVVVEGLAVIFDPRQPFVELRAIGVVLFGIAALKEEEHHFAGVLVEETEHIQDILFELPSEHGMSRAPAVLFEREFELQKPRALHEQIVRRHRLRHRHAVLQPFAQREHLAERSRLRGVFHAVFRRERKHVRVVSAEHRDVRYARVCFGDAFYVREHGAVGVIEVPLPHAETGVVAHHRE